MWSDLCDTALATAVSLNQVQQWAEPSSNFCRTSEEAIVLWQVMGHKRPSDAGRTVPEHNSFHKAFFATWHSEFALRVLNLALFTVVTVLWNWHYLYCKIML